jgi:ABC-type phosphate/phosphonate transport system ATPase subunit
MTSSQERITFIARTNFRNDRRIFGIRQTDRRAHMYLIGKTGTGKSTLLEMLVRQDIQAGQGIALLDPHGDLAERVLASLPEERKDDGSTSMSPTSPIPSPSIR